MSKFNLMRQPKSDLLLFFSSGSTELASGIVSTALQCGTSRCPTEDLELENPVIITIEHSEEVKVSNHGFPYTRAALLSLYQTRLMENETSSTECVFWDFIRYAAGP